MGAFFKRILQLGIVVSIFFIFALYIYYAQKAYDSTIDELTKATLFAVVIFAGGFSYDIAKHLAFISNDRFWVFFTHLKNAVIHLISIFALGAISQLLFNSDEFTHKYWGFWIHLLALSQTYWVVNHFTKAIESANNEENN